ncbi:MAG: EAL domain-containing protein [Gammaproteobacteria bacterium]|nr:EAL domain-containing protein [Gammaproteobacteria bacterium]
MSSLFHSIRKRFSLRKTRFSKQITFIFATGMIVLALSSSYATYTLSNKFLYERLTEEGAQTAKIFAEQCALALLYQSAENASDIVQVTMSSPDVQGVGIYLPDRTPLLEVGLIKSPEVTVEWPQLDPSQVHRDDIKKTWYYTSAVYSGIENSEYQNSPFMPELPAPQLLGYVRVAMSQQTLISMATKILQGNFAVSIILASLLLLTLLLITKRLIRPLRDLADLMLRAEHGEAFVRANVSGPKDIADMQHAFNTMMEVLEARETELLEARDLALESARIKGQFAANVTHELRTPLNGIIGMLQLLDNTELTEEQSKRIRTALNSSEALMSLINDILDFSKIDAGKADSQSKSFRLPDLIKDISTLLVTQAEKKGIYLRYKIEDEVPTNVSGESTRIRQVIFNLIGNAIKFTQSGGVELRVSCLKKHDNSAVIIEFRVIDTGIGISEDAQQKVFDAFSQADNTTARNYGGTGLGLTISRQLVEFMNGDIGVESQPGEGSQFWFSIPLDIASEDAVQKEESEQDDQWSREQLPKGLKVLVVDDNRTNQQVAHGMLERLGCEPSAVLSGEEALNVIFRNQYDVVLMDVQMPGMDGYEVTDQIRRLEQDGSGHIPIIAMTANNQAADIQHCLSVGMDDYLPKPFTREILHKKLLRWINKTVVDDQPRDSLHEAPKSLSAVKTGNVTEFLDAMVLNREALLVLQENAGNAYLEMIEVYLEDQVLYLDAIDKSIKEEDRQLLKRSAHTLKSSSRHFGAIKLGELCETIENIAELQPFDAIVSYIPSLKSNAQVVRKALYGELERLKNGQQQQNETSDLTAAKLLVVDDDRSMRVTMRAVLERDGYIIEECSNGAQALRQFEESPSDLVLMDAMMPGMDGFSTCRELRKTTLGKHTPILVVTALDDESSIDRAFAAGANDFIPKPVNFAVLRQRITRLLDASQTEKHVWHLAYHDTLTGLPNRRTFMERIQQLMQEPREEGDMIAVMFLDLDRFKLVNDTMGHDVGDMLLREVTIRIQDTLRSSDMVSRLGGDEFTVILNKMRSAEVVARIARKICNQLAKPFQLGNQQIYITTSIGIALYPNDTEDVNSLIKYADTAMFQAKEQRNSFRFYESGMEALVAKRMELENELRKALERDEFTLHYQPQVNAQSGEIEAVEALVRWQHPRKGMVSPADFIPLAEETGLIVPLGEWVLRRACLQLKEWLDKGYPRITMAVNISSRQLEEAKFDQIVLLVQAETGLPRGYLELEITESAIMKDPEKVIPALMELKKQGIGLAIDDFGTGHSSLNYLRRFPVDTLKIDRSFVNDIGKSEEDVVLVNGIIALAKSLKLKVVAEGVETKEQQDYLRERQCDKLQGYYLFKPMPADVFEQSTFYKRKVTNF